MCTLYVSVAKTIPTGSRASVEPIWILDEGRGRAVEVCASVREVVQMLDRGAKCPCYAVVGPPRSASLDRRPRLSVEEQTRMVLPDARDPLGISGGRADRRSSESGHVGFDAPRDPPTGRRQEPDVFPRVSRRR